MNLTEIGVSEELNNIIVDKGCKIVRIDATVSKGECYLKQDVGGRYEIYKAASDFSYAELLLIVEPEIPGVALNEEIKLLYKNDYGRNCMEYGKTEELLKDLRTLITMLKGTDGQYGLLDWVDSYYYDYTEEALNRCIEMENKYLNSTSQMVMTKTDINSGGSY